MANFEIIMLNIFRFIFFGWMIYATVTAYLIFKSDKYLQVKEMDKQVRFAKIDAKYEYKMALLNYKESKKKLNRRDNDLSMYYRSSSLADARKIYKDYVASGGSKTYEYFISWLYRLDFTRIEELDGAKELLKEVI